MLSYLCKTWRIVFFLGVDEVGEFEWGVESKRSWVKGALLVDVRPLGLVNGKR